MKHLKKKRVQAVVKNSKDGLRDKSTGALEQPNCGFDCHSFYRRNVQWRK